MRLLIFLLFIIFSISFSVGQERWTGKDYPYVKIRQRVAHLDQNHLLYPGDSAGFYSFFEKIDQLLFEGKGKVNIVHIGGSHIQADIWTGRIRERLQSYIPGNQGGRGFLFPFRMARTNNPYHYYPEFTGRWESCRNVQRKKVCDLGLSGMMVRTKDTLSNLKLTFRGDFAEGYDFNRIKIFHDPDSTSYSIEIDSVGDEFELIGYPEKGYSEIILKEYQKDLYLKFHKTNPAQDHFTLFGLSLETNDPGFTYHAIGVNGASVPSYLRCNLFSDQLKIIDPSLVVLSIGINDAFTTDFSVGNFELNYDSLIGMIKAAAPDCAILFTTNNDSYYKKRYPNKNGDKVRDAMMRLAKRHDAAVWDLYGVMGGLGSVDTWVKAGLARGDRVHFSVSGYNLVGDLMFNALLEGYDKYLEAKAGER